MNLASFTGNRWTALETSDRKRALWLRHLSSAPEHWLLAATSFLCDTGRVIYSLHASVCHLQTGTVLLWERMHFVLCKMFRYHGEDGHLNRQESFIYPQNRDTAIRLSKPREVKIFLVHLVLGTDVPMGNPTVHIIYITGARWGSNQDQSYFSQVTKAQLHTSILDPKGLSILGTLWQQSSLVETWHMTSDGGFLLI